MQQQQQQRNADTTTDERNQVDTTEHWEDRPPTEYAFQTTPDISPALPLSSSLSLSQSLTPSSTLGDFPEDVAQAACVCQGLLRHAAHAGRTDLAALEEAARTSQSLVCAAGIRERFRAIVDASSAFQGIVVGGTTGLGFLLEVVVVVWAQGAIRASLVAKRRARLEEHTQEAQGLFCAVVRRNLRFQPALGLVCYVQNVILDRKLEKRRAEEHAKLVAAAHARKPMSPAQKKSDAFVSIDSFKVDLSRHNLASMVPSKRPVWVPDSFSNTCSICSRQFTFGYRRHHCRNCGNLVCSQCTTFMPLMHLGYEKPERVCMPCKEFLLSTK